jgi:curved DNA-binding protein CbpA
MGQGQSQPQGQSQSMSVDDIYSMYIQQQQNLIVQQQQQINELYQMNLNQSQQPQQPHQQSSHQMSPNMVFQQLQQLQQQQQQQQLPNPSLKKLPSTKLDPYKILGLSKQYDESSLKKAYLKKAMKAHPDRGGSKHEFQKVSIAYTVLKKKLKERGEIHHHNELRDNAQSFMKTQPTQHISSGDNFDVAVFNKIYQDNRIEDAFDNGYGSWMEQTGQHGHKQQGQQQQQQKMFQGEFNKDMFNHEFQKYKQEQKQKMGSQIVQYEEPQVRISMKNQDSLATLGQGKITNFSGESNGLGFSDYKAAFTTDTTLIDEGSVDINGRANSIKGVERERANISYKMSAQDQQRVAYQEALQNKEERSRIQRLQVYDQKGEDMYNKVHQMLLR